VGLQADDSGIERNSVLAFKVLERIQPEADPFAPDDATLTPAGSVVPVGTKMETPEADPFAPETESGR
jgi:hypothetical protein